MNHRSTTGFRAAIPAALIRLTALSLWALLSVSALAAEPADSVVINAKIWTADPDRPWASAVAIRGKDFVYVGDAEGVKALVGPDTAVANLGGRVMLPGLIGTHDHPIATMALASGATLSFSQDAGTMLAELKDYVDANPQGPYFSFNGANENTVPITREDIDAIISDKPFLMVAATGHGGWINSAGLEALGVEKGKPDPVDSFERDENGEPTGNIPSSAAVMYALVNLGVLTREGMMAKSHEILELINGYGFTAIFDPGQPPGTEDMSFGVISELEQSGELTVRIMASALTQREPHIPYAKEILTKYGPMYSSEMFNVNWLKLHGGSPDGYTSAFLEDYSDRPGHRGQVPYSPEAQAEAAIWAAANGFDVHTHAMGDANIRQALDTYAAVRKAGYTDTRLTTGHTALVYPDQVQRYAELDVIANTFGRRNAQPEPTIASRVGPERLKYWQPMKSFLDAGVRLTASADWPTAPINPWEQIVVFMTRSVPDNPEALAPESERLTLEESLVAYTRDAAYQLRMEDKIGMIQPGKRADLIVIDRDIFSFDDPNLIWDTNVMITMLNGEVVFEEAVDWGEIMIGVEGMSLHD